RRVGVLVGFGREIVPGASTGGGAAVGPRRLGAGPVGADRIGASSGRRLCGAGHGVGPGPGHPRRRRCVDINNTVWATTRMWTTAARIGVTGPVVASSSVLSLAGVAWIAPTGTARSAAARARSARGGAAPARSCAARTAAAGPAPAGAGILPGDSLDAHLDAHDAADGVGDVLGGGAAVEGGDQAVGAEAEHQGGATHLVHVGVLRDQCPAGTADLGELVEDGRPVAAHRVGIRAPRCRLLGRGSTRRALLGGVGPFVMPARTGLH